MQSKCLIEFCNNLTTKTSRIPIFNCLCRHHQVDVAESLMKHLPHSHATVRHAFTVTPQGRTWFADWVRLVDGMNRADLEKK